MKRLFLSLLSVPLAGMLASGQPSDASFNWESSIRKTDDGRCEIVLRGISTEPSDGDLAVHGSLEWISCSEDRCHSPENYDYSLELAPVSESQSSSSVRAYPGTAASETGEGGGLLALILEAILWGFAMLLTPCVFPMVPMTVSFFLKGREDSKEGRFRALMYGLFIVVLYTVPVCLITGITRLAGGAAVTADIFNWLSTHWLPNLLFFAVFMAFALSFFGAFEINLPASIVNRSDRNSDRKGLAGVFFMALTLVLVSFSCTGPIVGTVLIKSTAGEFWTPMVTMLAFSMAFAVPFTVLAFFPSLLKSLPRSGGWLNSVKVTLGFVEVALGFKFLSVADQTYHWGLLGREIYLAIWIVCFSLLGFYLLGKIRFKNDDATQTVSLKRLLLAMVDFVFVIYMIPGMWGAPLKALSGYLPPLSTQDFVVETGNEPAVSEAPAAGASGLPYGLNGYRTIEDAVSAASRSGKKIFLDITGHGCVNCREMEYRVWSDPQVLQLLRDEFIIAALYVDDKTALPESQWVVTADEKILKDVGRVNSYVARTRFGVNSQPSYFILSPEGEVMSGPRGYDTDVEGFVAFLKGHTDK